jgi:hypothetical protein
MRIKFPVKNETPFKLDTHITLLNKGQNIEDILSFMNKRHFSIFGYDLCSYVVIKDIMNIKYNDIVLVQINNSLGFARGEWIKDESSITELFPIYKIGNAGYHIVQVYQDYKEGFKYVDEDWEPLVQNVKYKKINGENHYFSMYEQSFRIGDKLFDPNFIVTWGNVEWEYILQYCEVMNIKPPKNKYDATVNNYNIVLNPIAGKMSVKELIPFNKQGDKTIETKEDAILACVNFNTFKSQDII